VLKFTVFSVYVHAAGANPVAVRGLPVRTTLISVFAVSGLMSALGGILLTSVCALFSLRKRKGMSLTQLPLWCWWNQLELPTGQRVGRFRCRYVGAGFAQF